MLNAGTVTGIVGILGVLVGAVVGIVSVVLLHRQTLIMQRQMERAFDPDSNGGSQFEQKMRMLINKRVGDVRRELRHEFTRQLENAFAPVGNEHESNQPDSNQSDSNQPDSNEGLQAEKNTRTLINKRLRSERGRLRSEFYRKLGIIEERVGEQRVQMSETLGSEQVKMLIGLSQQVQTYQTEIQLRQSEATSTIKQVAQEVYDSANDMLQATDAARSDIMINAQRIIAQVGRYEVDIATHSREIDSIGAELAGLHDATDPQQMARNTLRILGEHLLRITNS